MWQNSTTQNVTKIKLWQNSNCDKTHIVPKLQNSKCENSNCDQTQFKKINYDKSQLKKNKQVLERKFWHLDNQWDVLWAAFCNSPNVFTLHCYRGLY